MRGTEILVKYLLESGIDVEVTHDYDQDNCYTCVELIDMETDTCIGFTRRDTLEEALFHLVAKCVDNVRRVKVDYNSFNINNTDVEEQ